MRCCPSATRMLADLPSEGSPGRLLALLRGPRISWPGRAPAIGMADFLQGTPGQRSEFVERPADWHQCPGRDILGNPEQQFDFMLAANVISGNHGAQPKSAASEKNV